MGADVSESFPRYPYSPITQREPWTWPGGRRLAVWVGVGIEDYRIDGEHVENLLPEASRPDLVNTAWRDYGNRVGGFRILDRLAELGVPPTVMLNTMVYNTAPALAHAARKHGAEVVGHGISNSDSLAGRDIDNERAYLAEVARCIAGEEGDRPGGWSSPWLAHTDNTIDLLAEQGYRYLLDLRLDDQPVWLNTRSAPLLAIPYPLELNDSTSVIGRSASAGEFAEMIVDEFDELVSAVEDQPLVMGIVLHSFISGAPFRLAAVTRALRHLTSQREAVWFTQPRHIYDAFAAAVPAERDAPSVKSADQPSPAATSQREAAQEMTDL
ncbi:MAG: polysaccharide deacetylase [Pseudonocardiales bacterium]|nr:polysaccharide deacetylase [Pseudonocardiales bacterium]